MQAANKLNKVENVLVPDTVSKFQNLIDFGRQIKTK